LTEIDHNLHNSQTDYNLLISKITEVNFPVAPPNTLPCEWQSSGALRVQYFHFLFHH